MAGSLNKVMLIGNVGADPIIRQTQDGKKIATLSLATTDSWKDKATGEKRDKTEWHRIVIFNEGLSGVVENYVKKGQQLFIEGLMTSTFNLFNSSTYSLSLLVFVSVVDMEAAINSSLW